MAALTRQNSSSSAVALAALFIVGLACVIGSIQGAPVAEVIDAEVGAGNRILTCPPGWVERDRGTPWAASDVDGAVESLADADAFGPCRPRYCCKNGTIVCFRRPFPCPRPPIPRPPIPRPRPTEQQIALDEPAEQAPAVAEPDQAEVFASDFDFDVPVALDVEPNLIEFDGPVASEVDAENAEAAGAAAAARCCAPRVQCYVTPQGVRCRVQLVCRFPC